jgi:hypothetical protein
MIHPLTLYAERLPLTVRGGAWAVCLQPCSTERMEARPHLRLTLILLLML